MANVVIKVEGLSKRYRLGTIGRTALHEDLSRWWARLRGRPDPTLRIDQVARRDAAALRDDEEHVWALRDVSFEVTQGEVLGIVGRNGAGKSTLLKILSRVTGPTLGCVKVRGRIASLLEVGTGFHPELTGRENIFLNGSILGMRRAEISGKLDEIIAFAGVETYIDTPVKRYSSGMYVRLAFAVAAHLEPEILVVDEVLAVGDAEFQKKCLGKMRDVAGHGRTVLFVSHNIAAIQNLCSSCLFLKQGMLLEAGPALEVTNAYLSATLPTDRAVDFAKRTAPLENRPLYMTGVHVYESGAVEREHKGVRVGSDVVLEIRYKACCKVEDVTFFFCLHDVRDDALMLHINTRMGHGTIGEISGEGSARCRVPGFPLVPGEYRLDVGVLSRSDFLDRETSAMTVHVFPSDFFGTGYANLAAAGRILFKHSWELQPSAGMRQRALP